MYPRSEIIRIAVCRDYGLVPIAYEDYGGSLVNLGTEVNSYYAVAVARRRDTELTLFNLKRKSSSHAATANRVPAPLKSRPYGTVEI